MSVVVPQSLKAGDKVAIVGTARKISAEEIQAAVQTIKSWNLQPIVGDTIGKEDFQFAGTDEERIADMQKMLNDDSIKAIICARGGYGTVRIIDELDFRRLLKKPKWICGFSDATVLHSHLHTVYNVKTLHSPMAHGFATNTPESLESIRKVLFGERLKYELQPDELNRLGRAEGTLVGGNLSLLSTLTGTASDIDTADKILFIEDIDEHLYHLDRMMQQLKRSGKLENLAGLIVGHFTDMKNKDEANPFGKTAFEIIAEAVSEFEYPLIYGFPAGHEAENRALILGGKAKLRVEEAKVLVEFV